MSEELEGPEIKVALTVKDKEGRVISKHEEEAHSWLNNYYKWLAALMRIGSIQPVTSDAGNVLSIVAGKGLKSWDADTSASTNIAIGKSDAVWDVNQYALQDLITHQEIEKVSDDATARTVIFQASITPASAVTIKEVGILFTLVTPVPSGAVFRLYIERTVLGTPEDVPEGGSVIAEYTISHKFQ